MRELHLFAGIGGGMLAGQMLGHTPVCAVEIEPFCRAVIAKHWPGLPLHDDIRTFSGLAWRGRVDIVCGGFPCQDISVAGKGTGLGGSRSGLWFEMLRVVREVGPRFVFVENSPMLRTRGLGVVLRGLAELGFDAAWDVVSAEDVGACHLRKRMWILAVQMADADCGRREGERVEEPAGIEGARGDQPDGCGQVRELEDAAVAYAGSAGLAAEREALLGTRRWNEGGAATERGWWSAEPDVGRVAHGVPARVDRLRALGNAQVPLQAATAFRRLSRILQESP